MRSRKPGRATTSLKNALPLPLFLGWETGRSVARRCRFFIGGSHFDFGPLRVALCSNDSLRLHTGLAVLQQGVCRRIPAGSLCRSHSHTKPMRRPPAGRHRKHDSHSLSSRQTICRNAAYCQLRNCAKRSPLTRLRVMRARGCFEIYGGWRRANKEESYERCCLKRQNLP
jgi:hypothetical protein